MKNQKSGSLKDYPAVGNTSTPSGFPKNSNKPLSTAPIKTTMSPGMKKLLMGSLKSQVGTNLVIDTEKMKAVSERIQNQGIAERNYQSPMVWLFNLVMSIFRKN